jgi:hypothetical protein
MQPFNVTDYMSSFRDLKGFPVFAFNTFGSYRFDAGNVFLKHLANKRARLLGYFACHGAGFIWDTLEGLFVLPGLS